MLKKTSKCNCIFLIYFLLFSCNSVFAQATKKTTLSEIFKSLETKFDIRLSYAANDFKNISINPPQFNSTLDESLAYLEQKTPYTFSKIDQRYITVVLKVEVESRCGRVIGATTSLPLIDAKIIGISSTTTNSEGTFYIPNHNNSGTITITHIGFETVQIPFSSFSGDCLDIFMQPIISYLDPVTLQKYFTMGISKQMDGSFVINTNNFGLLPGQVNGDILQITQALPGVESVDETISNINIRGGTHDENNILWDDIKMYQSGHFFGLISAFNPDLTKNVRVYKNGTNPRFGEGVSGVIDMHSQNEIADSFTGGAGFDLINTHAFAEIPVSKSVGIQVSGRRSINDFLMSPVFGIYEDRIFQDTEITTLENNATSAEITSENNFKFYDFSAKVLFDLSDKSSFRANFLTIRNDLAFTETLLSSSNSETSNLKQSSTVGGLSWQQIWTPKIKTNLLGYGSYYQLNSVSEEIFTTQKLTQENEVLELGIKLDSYIALSEKMQLQTGYHFSETGIANTQDVNLPRFRSFRRDVLRTHIAFANIGFTTFENKTNLNIGFRANYFTKFDKVLIEPRFTLNHKLGNGFSAEILGEFKSQSTTQRIDFDSDFLGVEKRRWILADNDGVPLIQSKQISAGLVYNKLNWFVNLEGFYKRVEGITSRNQGFQNQFQFVQEQGHYSSRGLEFVLNKKTKSFSTWLSYLLMKNDYYFKALNPPEFPSNFDVRHTATLASTYSYKKLKLALGLNWRSGKPYTEPLSSEEVIFTDGTQIIQFDTPNNKRLSNYFRANLSAEYLWRFSEKVKGKINVAILNIFNTKNILNRRYSLDVDENNEFRINKIDEISLGITPNFSLQLLF
ncbi:MAG: hypothetical protein ACI83B_001056 [Sediminicola sp.]|jgi:hypothetical protein